MDLVKKNIDQITKKADAVITGDVK